MGVNTFLPTNPDEAAVREIPLTRASPEEKEGAIERLEAFHERHRERAPAALERLRRTALDGGNVFAELMEAVQVGSLGQITEALYEVGGEYRRNL